MVENFKETGVSHLHTRSSAYEAVRRKLAERLVALCERREATSDPDAIEMLDSAIDRVTKDLNRLEGICEHH